MEKSELEKVGGLEIDEFRLEDMFNDWWDESSATIMDSQEQSTVWVEVEKSLVNSSMTMTLVGCVQEESENWNLQVRLEREIGQSHSFTHTFDSFSTAIHPMEVMGKIFQISRS